MSPYPFLMFIKLRDEMFFLKHDGKLNIAPSTAFMNTTRAPKMGGRIVICSDIQSVRIHSPFEYETSQELCGTYYQEEDVCSRLMEVEFEYDRLAPGSEIYVRSKDDSRWYPGIIMISCTYLQSEKASCDIHSFNGFHKTVQIADLFVFKRECAPAAATASYRAPKRQKRKSLKQLQQNSTNNNGSTNNHSNNNKNNKNVSATVFPDDRSPDCNYMADVEPAAPQPFCPSSDENAPPDTNSNHHYNNNNNSMNLIPKMSWMHIEGLLATESAANNSRWVVN